MNQKGERGIGRGVDPQWTGRIPQIQKTLQQLRNGYNLIKVQTRNINS